MVLFRHVSVLPSQEIIKCNSEGKFDLRCTVIDLRKDFERVYCIVLIKNILMHELEFVNEDECALRIT